jgi:hypothetical protein
MFSCCCARVDRTWRPVCGCFEETGKCSFQCLRNETKYENSYYDAAKVGYPGRRNCIVSASISRIFGRRPTGVFMMTDLQGALTPFDVFFLVGLGHL